MFHVLSAVVAWALAVAHAATAVLSWKYFFLGPTLFGVVISTLLAYGAIATDSIQAWAGVTL